MFFERRQRISIPLFRPLETISSTGFPHPRALRKNPALFSRRSPTPVRLHYSLLDIARFFIFLASVGEPNPAHAAENHPPPAWPGHSLPRNFSTIAPPRSRPGTVRSTLPRTP